MMNVRKSIWCCLVLFGAVMATVHAQPVVKVPSTCEVIVAGSGVGVLTGFGGVVGNGGIVVMPDPFDIPGGAGNFKIIPNGTSTSSWSLLGDLSFQTASTMTPTTVTGSGLIQNIESFNKNQRFSEGLLPSSMNLARSKGRVTINYVSPPCNASIAFEVYKTYPNTGSGSGYVPPIIGPSCWDPNTTVTYSVDPVASDNLTDAVGTDKYYWTITNGTSPITSFYGSSDLSSVTFTTPAVVSGVWTIACCYGRANPWDGDIIPFGSHTTCVTKLVNSPVPAPVFLPVLPTCLNTGVTTFSAALTPVPGLTYAWSYMGSGGATAVGSGTFNEVVTVSGMNDNPGTLILSVSNSIGLCPAVQAFQYQIGRNFVAPMVLTTTPSSSCLSPGSTFQVSLPASAQLNATTWTMPSAAWAFVPNNSSASVISVTVPIAAAAGSYVISAASTSCPSGVIPITVTVQPSPVFTAGPTCINTGSTTPITYTVSSSGPATYTWTIPPGWTGSSASNSITVTPNGSSVGNVSVTVCTSLACCNTVTRAVAFVPTAPIINFPACYNVGIPGAAMFSVAPPLSGTYSWSVDASFGTPAVATGSSINVSTIGTPGVYPAAVTVVQTTSCGSSAPSSVPVTLVPNGNLVITPGPGFESVSVSGFTGPSIFKWLQDCGLPTESVCIPCGTSFVTTFSNISTAGSWGVIVTDPFGCYTKLCTNTSYGNRQAQPGDPTEHEDALGSQIALSPNPNGGEFDVHIPKVKTDAQMIVYNAFGQQVLTTKMKAGTNRFNQSTLASGIYFLHIMVDGKVAIKKMEIRH